MAKFGWCIDGVDDTCIKSFNWYGTDVLCDCPCHGGKPVIKKKRKRVSKVTAPVLENPAPESPIVYNKDGSVRKKRGRPKGSKNKPKG